jgi:hypothetical protein
MTTKSFSVISVSVIAVVALVGAILTSALRTADTRVPDKNGPSVVRVSIVEGSAVVQRGDTHAQTNAVPNAPMLPGDYIWSGKTSRVELQFDGYTALRLTGSAQVRIVSNDPNNRKVQLAAGTIEVGTVRDGRAMEIDTPSVTVRTRDAGDVRISIAVDGSSLVAARRGSVDAVTPQRTYPLGPGTTLVAGGSASNPSIAQGPEVAFDAFDDFNAERDRTMVAALNASPNLNPTLAGYDNLDAYGQWQSVAGYGQSWVPNEPAGWAPYRNGSWTWEDGYGWTWIGSEPWGWAPYHYGNWYYCSCGASGWAWLPPASGSAPAWSPALVGFFEFNTGADVAYNNNCGGNFGYAPGSYNAPAAPSSNTAPGAPYSPGTPAPYGVGGGPEDNGYPETPYGEGSGYPPGYGNPYPYIAWVPIAPFEPFYPWYASAGIGFGWGFPATSITNITYINRIYRNFRHGGASATTFRHFRHGTVHGHTVSVNPRDIGRRLRTIHGALPISPTRDNLAFSHGQAHAPVTFSKTFKSPRFTSDRALAARASFAQQQKAVAEAIHGGPTSHAPAHATVARANARGSHANVPETHTSTNAAMSHQIAAVRPENAPVTRENAAPAARTNAAPTARTNAAPRENNVGAPANVEMREGSAASRQVDASRSGEARPAEFPARSDGANSSAGSRERSAPSEGGREEGAPSDSWGRFSTSRGESYESTRNPYNDREAGREDQTQSDPWGRFSTSRAESYESTRNPYQTERNPDTERGSYPSYSRGSYPSYSRGSYPSYSRGSYPSYSRGSYPSYSRGSYPSYSRGSYPSYSRGSYPSYSRGSYPSYSLGSYPSYSRGSYPSYSRGSYPSYSRGSYGSGPSSSRGYSAPSHPSGGSGGRPGGGGRPPH